MTPATARRPGAAAAGESGQPRLFDGFRREKPERPVGRRDRRPCSDGGRLTLEQQLDGVWEGLLAAGAAPCPVCGERMTPAAGGGRCGGCGSELT